jgi:hypothetical protein
MELVGLSEPKEKLDINDLEVLEVDLKIENQKDFFGLIMLKYNKYLKSRL